MEQWLLIIAALIAAGGAVFHGYVGGKIYLSNISASDLDPLMGSLSAVSWQMFTVFLVVSGGSLICVAIEPEWALLAHPVLLGNGLGALLFLSRSLLGHSRLLKIPGMYLMGATALLGWLGLP